MRTTALLLFLLSSVGGCRCNKEQQQNDSSSVVSDTTTPHPLQQLDTTKTGAEWERYYSVTEPAFSFTGFNEAARYQTEMKTKQLTGYAAFEALYGTVLVYNADSTLAVDIYSYNTIIEQTASGLREARGGEPDQEVAVIDCRKKTRTRLLFCGPACSFQRAGWMDEETVAVMGLTDEDGDGTFVASVWRINTRTGETVVYEYPQPVAGIDPLAYARKYFNEKGIRLVD